MRHHFKYLSLMAAVIAVMWPCGGAMAQGSGGKLVTIRVAIALPEAHSYTKWAKDFGVELNKLVPNRVEVKVFANAQLGKEVEYLEGMTLGTIEASILGRHGQIDPRMEVLNLPMIYRDAAHLDAVLRKGGAVQQKLEGIMYEHGYKVLGWGELGFRDITTKNTPIRKASDLKGLDIRVPNVEPWLVAFRAWGANPTPMDFSELYSALQQGVVSAQENPPELTYTSKFYEVQKYLSLTEHANIPCEFLLARAFWEKLPADLKEAVTKAATLSRDVQVTEARKANAKLVDDLAAKGMTIIRDVDKASFWAGAVEAYKKYEDKIGKDLIQAVQDAR